MAAATERMRTNHPPLPLKWKKTTTMNEPRATTTAIRSTVDAAHSFISCRVSESAGGSGINSFSVDLRCHWQRSFLILNFRFLLHCHLHQIHVGDFFLCHVRCCRGADNDNDDNQQIC